MKPLTIIECAAEDGLILTASPDGKIKISGDQNKINEWIETIRENKEAIFAELTDSKYTAVVTDADTDPVLVTVRIKGLATFEVQIPRARYDGITLLELIEKHSTEPAPVRMAA